MKLNCPGCEKFFGEEVMPLLITTSYLTRAVPIIGIDAKTSHGIIWELYHAQTETEEGDILEYEYQCSHCGAGLSEDFVALIFEEGE